MNTLVDIRKNIIHEINSQLTILSVEIDRLQSLNDTSLNIHSENAYRDIFNCVFKDKEYRLENTNFHSGNFPCIDLVDHNQKVCYQVTSTCSADKVRSTFRIKNKKEYKDYDVYMIFLVGNITVKTKTLDDIGEELKCSISKDNLIDGKKLIQIIANMETNDLQALYEKYFSNQGQSQVTKELIKTGDNSIVATGNHNINISNPQQVVLASPVLQISPKPEIFADIINGLIKNEQIRYDDFDDIEFPSDIMIKITHNSIIYGRDIIEEAKLGHNITVLQNVLTALRPDMTQLDKRLIKSVKDAYKAGLKQYNINPDNYNENDLMQKVNTINKSDLILEHAYTHILKKVNKACNLSDGLYEDQLEKGVKVIIAHVFILCKIFLKPEEKSLLL